MFVMQKGSRNSYSIIYQNTVNTLGMFHLIIRCTRMSNVQYIMYKWDLKGSTSFQVKNKS